MAEARGAAPLPLAPGSAIGILGGGQLGRMLAMAAARLGYRTIVLDPDPQAPAAQCASQHLLAGYEDSAAIAELVRLCDVVTYEFENIPVETARRIAQARPLFPPVSALEHSQDRAAEKSFLNGIGVATAPWRAIGDAAELPAALSAVGGRGILKTRRMGYDGKGQARIDAAGEAHAAWQALGGRDLVLEGLVDFAMEISVIAGRGRDGTLRAYDPPRNVHRDGILRTSSVPADADGAVLAQAIAIARHIADALGYVGVIGVEFFVERDGGLLVNEIAPRVHNSGHWTEAACAISQFEQHVRAIAGLPLGHTTRHSDCVMENLIGADIEKVPAILAEGSAVLHLYGKAEARPGRKMGHVTRLSPPRRPGTEDDASGVDKKG